MPSNAILFTICVLVWGTTFYAIKLQLGVVSPALSLAYRFGLAAVMLLAYAVWKKERVVWGWADHGRMALQGLTMFGLAYVLVYYASVYLPSGVVAILYSTIVGMNIISARIFLGYPIQSRVVAGAILGTLGVSLVFLNDIRSFETSSDSIEGLVLAFASIFCASLGNIIATRNQKMGLPALMLNGYGMAYGAVFIFLLALVMGDPVRFEWSARYIGSLVYLSVVGSVLAFGCYLVLLKNMGPARAAYVAVFFPLISLAISTVFENFVWTMSSLLGVTVIFLGNVLIVRAKS